MSSSVPETNQLALYGNVRFRRATCQVCNEVALVVRGVFQCCGLKDETQPQTIRRMSEPWFGRRPLSKFEKARILREQSNACFYCFRRFGSTIWKRTRQKTLRIHWDHMIPWIHSQDNSASNHVAACQICNQIKSDRFFSGPDEARAFLSNEWARRKITDRRPPKADVFDRAGLAPESERNGDVE